MVRNLIFDVGGVLIGYRWYEMMTDDFGLSEEKTQQMAHRVYDDPLWCDLDRGLVELDALLEHYCSLYPEDSEIIMDLFVDKDRMVVPRPRVWEKMKTLKEKGYRMYILSNYSESLFRRHTDGLPFRDLVDGGVVSYEVKMIKPEAGIYESLLTKYGLDPAECLFFDDIPANIEGANKAGIDGFVITSEENLLSLLDKY